MDTEHDDRRAMTLTGPVSRRAALHGPGGAGIATEVTACAMPKSGLMSDETRMYARSAKEVPVFAMRRFKRLIAVVAGVVLLGAVGIGVVAQGGPPPPDAVPGAIDVTGAALGGVDTVIAPGYRLVMAETVFAPGGYVTRHTHPSAIVACVQSGVLGFALQHGAATVTRAAGAGTPAPTEPLALNTEVVLHPRDCVAFDHFAAHTEHTAWNASDGPTVLWEARLLKVGEPFTTFVDAQGTPVP